MSAIRSVRSGVVVGIAAAVMVEMRYERHGRERQASIVTGPRHLPGATTVKLLVPPRPPTGDSF